MCYNGHTMQKAKHRPNTVTKIVRVEAPARNGNGTHSKHGWMPGDPPELHPLFSSFGAFKDDPSLDEFVQAMDDERRKIDERYPVEDDEAPALQEAERNVRT